MSLIDDLSPTFVGEEALELALSAETPNPAAFGAVTLDVDYSGAGEAGTALPLELIVAAPTRAGYVHRYFRHQRPPSLTFFPVEGGEHLVLLREVGHNRYHGKLLVDVAGDEIQEA